MALPRRPFPRVKVWARGWVNLHLRRFVTSLVREVLVPWLTLPPDIRMRKIQKSPNFPKTKRGIINIMCLTLCIVLHVDTVDYMVMHVW